MPSADGGEPAEDAGAAADTAMFAIDRSLFFGAARCTGRRFLLCEDFESGTLDTKVWSVSGPTPRIERHGGRQDVRYDLPEFTALWIGWQEYQPATQKFEMWVDEIAVDTQRIGCER